MANLIFYIFQIIKTHERSFRLVNQNGIKNYLVLCSPQSNLFSIFASISSLETKNNESNF